MIASHFQEVDFNVRDLQIRVKLWNAESSHRVIALHGWLDNAASFDVVAPLLQGCAVAAIDLPGQGFSEHRPPSASYHLWDDLLDILLVANQLGWDRFTLLGHSRGAMLAVLLAASSPERVERLFLIDGLMPIPVEISNSPSQLRSFLHDYIEVSQALRVFVDRESAIAARARAGSIPVAVAEMLAVRNLRMRENGWVWQVDNRLKAASAIKLSREHIAAFLGSVHCPVLVFLASQGFGSYPEIDQLQQAYPHFVWRRLDGHHHLHMDVQAGEVARLCLEAWS